MARKKIKRQIIRKVVNFYEDDGQKWTAWEDRSNLRGHHLWPEGMERCYRNNVYWAQFYPRNTHWGPVTLMMVGRHDRKPIHNWAHMQRIKNELCGR